jgi:hypothetical protein
MVAMAGQVLCQPSLALTSLGQAVAQGVEMVAVQPKVERVDRAAGATPAAQTETQEQPGQLTRAAAAVRAGFKQARITLANQAVAA